MSLCKFFSFFPKTPIMMSMKTIKKKQKKLEVWKKKIASFFWLDDCAGGISLRERKWKREILCVLHRDGSYMLPKWQVKEWESFADAALREFREETGIQNVALWEKIAVIRDRIRRKKIIFFSMNHGESAMTAIRDEAIMWVEVEKSAKKMKHESERKFIEKHLL
jgi:ADP-ribose pyrophosphatase YjhB (NUDIX family)